MLSRIIGFVLLIILGTHQDSEALTWKKPWVEKDLNARVHINEIVETINTHGQKRVCEGGNLKSRFARNKDDWRFRQNGSIKNDDELMLSVILCSPFDDFYQSSYGNAARNSLNKKNMNIFAFIESVKKNLEMPIDASKPNIYRQVFSKTTLDKLIPKSNAYELAELSTRLTVLHNWMSPEDQLKHKEAIDKVRLKLGQMQKEGELDPEWKPIFEGHEDTHQLFVYMRDKNNKLITGEIFVFDLITGEFQEKI